MSKLLLTISVVGLMLASASHAQQSTVPAKSAAKPNTSTASTSTAKPVAKTNSALQTQPKAATRADRLDLDTTVVTGNRELPKVLYIVPWKKAELGELPAQPFNTLLDEVLQPVDREVFKREVKYFQTVSNGVGSAAASPASVPAAVQPAAGSK